MGAAGILGECSPFRSGLIEPVKLSYSVQQTSWPQSRLPVYDLRIYTFGSWILELCNKYRSIWTTKDGHDQLSSPSSLQYGGFNILRGQAANLSFAVLNGIRFICFLLIIKTMPAPWKEKGFPYRGLCVKLVHRGLKLNPKPKRLKSKQFNGY